MAGLFESRKERNEHLTKAEALVATAEREKRGMTNVETHDFDMAMSIVANLDRNIAAIESKNTLRAQFPRGVIPGNGADSRITKPQPKTLSHDYVSALFASIKSGGRIASDVLSEGADALGGYAVPTLIAALREGSNAAGGYAVPIVVDSQIVPLAPNEMAIRQLATVIETSSDIKIPTKATKGTAAAKLEGDGTGTNVFGGTAPTLGQVTLSAFMGGDILDVSWEALEDISLFQAFCVDDLITAITEYEEPKFISGTGSGQPQGIATGADVGVTVTGGHLVQGAITIDSLDDLIGSLKESYLPNASLLMRRATAVSIRKLLRALNLFEPRWTRVGTQDYYDGFPVFYSSAMPDGLTDQDRPVLFGDFKRAFVIGDRGGSGIRVKILDQPKAAEGITQLLAYRRTDSRVRRSEAVKALKLATGA